MNFRCLAALCVAIATSAPMAAQEIKRLEPEKLALITKPVIASTSKLTDLPFPLALDGDKAMGLEHRRVGFLVIPDGKLSLETLAQAENKVVPLGVLYFHNVTPVAGGAAVASDQHRTVEVTVGEKSATLNVLPLAATRVAGKLVLLTYTAKREPTLVAELADADESKAAVLELEARGAGDGRAVLTISVLSKYRAVMTLAGQE